MTRARAAEIHRRDYWDTVRGDDLPFGLDLCAFDGAVNSGYLGGEVAQQALGWKPMNRPRHPAAARSTYQFRRDPAGGCVPHLTFLKQLPGWAHFGAGWASRMKAVEAEAACDSRSGPRTAGASRRGAAARAAVRRRVVGTGNLRHFDVLFKEMENVTMKYLKPKSLTWWAGFVPCSLALSWRCPTCYGACPGRSGDRRHDRQRRTGGAGQRRAGLPSGFGGQWRSRMCQLPKKRVAITEDGQNCPPDKFIRF